MGILDARLMAPGDPDRSILLQRMKDLGERRMPPLASHLVDDYGVSVIEAWIKSLANCPN